MKIGNDTQIGVKMYFSNYIAFPYSTNLKNPLEKRFKPPQINL